jgi:methylated-DNA-[protein]-cysteine S-methyltransferase
MIEDLERQLAAGPPPGTGTPAAEAARRVARGAAEAGLLDVAYAHVDSPLGPLLVAGTERGLVRLAYPTEREDAVLDGLAARLSPRVLEAPERLDPVRRALDEYFEGRRPDLDVPLDWSLTSGFTRRVLQRTARIPVGQTLTYREVAADAGSPAGSRAAGNALGSNPIPIVVPCHRVVRSGGALGGYTGGVERKVFLLRLEGVPLP